MVECRWVEDSYEDDDGNDIYFQTYCCNCYRFRNWDLDEKDEESCEE